MKLEVIIPVTVMFEMAHSLLDNLACNTILPDRVIIIDNSINGTRFLELKSYPFELDIYSDGIRKSCNASWNLGITKISRNCAYVTILNDDIAVGPWFFDRVLGVFNYNSKVGVSCPETIQDSKWLKKTLLLNDSPELPDISKMKKREGGAFTFKRTVLDRIPPIPSKLKAFYGDDWFWRWTYKLGYLWMKDSSNKIFHLGGATNLKVGIGRSDYYAEKGLWVDVVEEYGLQRNRK